MKTLKIIGILLCSVLFVMGSKAFAAGSITVKVGHGHSIQHPVNKGLSLFKEVVDKRSNGRIKVQIFPSCQLGNESEMAELCKMGNIQGIMFGRFEEQSPMLYGINLPFLFKNFAHADRVLKGPVGDYLASFCEDHGLKLVGWSFTGFRQITNNVRPIRKPEDLKGLKIRTPPNENYIRSMKAFGASPTPIPYSEVYMACKTGVVDGQENPFVNIYSEKFYEVQKYITVVNYVCGQGPFFFGLKWFKSLPAEDQTILANAAKICTEYTNVLTIASNDKYLQLLKKEGMQVHTLTDEERAEFVKMVGPVYDYFIQKGITTKRMIDFMQRQ